MAHDQPTRRQTFPLAFRLKRKRLIRPLFDRGRNDVGSVVAGCIRLVFRLVDRSEAGASAPLQVGFTTGRGIRKAVDRNRIKRYLREAYRLNQYILRDGLAGRHDELLTLMVIFRGDPEKARRQIPHHLPNALSRLIVKIQEGYTPD